VPSVQQDVFNHMSAITPPPTVATHTQVRGCIIGPNDEDEFSRVVKQTAVLRLSSNNLTLPIGATYSVYEGGAKQLLNARELGGAAVRDVCLLD